MLHTPDLGSEVVLHTQLGTAHSAKQGSSGALQAYLHEAVL